MTARRRLEDAEIQAFLAEAPGWARAGDALERSFAFATYGDGLGFAVAVGVLAERADHHPELSIGWRKVVVRWTTHDRGGVTELDLDLARRTDAAFAARSGP